MKKTLLFTALTALTSATHTTDTFTNIDTSTAPVNLSERFSSIFGPHGVIVNCVRLASKAGVLTDETNRLYHFRKTITNCVKTNNITLLNHSLSGEQKDHLDIIDNTPITVTGYNALTYATIYGSAEMVQLLINHGANPNHKNKYGKVALQYLDKNDLQHDLKASILLGKRTLTLQFSY